MIFSYGLLHVLLSDISRAGKLKTFIPFSKMMNEKTGTSGIFPYIIF
jgi:hypothetical protein